MIKRLSALPATDQNDWRQIRDLCCRTGNGGAPVGPERWQFFARIWIDPYRIIIPQWTYAAVTGETVVGYLTGCPDTRHFRQACFWKVWLRLATEIMLGAYSEASDSKKFLRQFFLLEKTPERSFPRQFRSELLNSYPAHLHINVDAKFRNGGIGAQLITAFLRDLQNAAVEGVHLNCGVGPLEFYRRCGFNEMMTIQFRGATVYALGLRLPASTPAGRS